MTDPIHSALKVAAIKSKTDPKYANLHNDDQLAYVTIKKSAEAKGYPIPTFEQVQYQRNLADLDKLVKGTTKKHEQKQGKLDRSV